MLKNISMNTKASRTQQSTIPNACYTMKMNRHTKSNGEKKQLIRPNPILVQTWELKDKEAKTAIGMYLPWSTN